MITAAQIKRARKLADKSPTDFAKLLGVSRPTLFNWENGRLPKFGPTIAHVEQVLADLSVDRSRRVSA